MKFKYKTKKRVGKILSIVLLCAIAVGAIFGVSAIAKKLNSDVKTLNLSYHSGTLNSNGLPEDNANAMYSEEFVCAGLSITPEFDSNVEYRVAFYDINSAFISMTALESLATTPDIPTSAVHARILITPKATYDNEDGKLSYFERLDLANDLTVKVFRKQASYDQFEIVFDEELEGKIFSSTPTVGEPLAFNWETEQFAVTEAIAVHDVDSLLINSTIPNSFARYAFLDSSENFISGSSVQTDDEGYLRIDIPDNVTYIRIILDNSATYYAWFVK